MAGLISIAPDLWVTRRPLRFFGVELGATMTVVRTDGGLVVHSPIKPDAKLLEELAAIGEVRWAVAPNKLHHLFLGDWGEQGAQMWGVAGLHQKRADLTFYGAVGEGDPWGPTFETFQLTCIPFSEEAVFFHVPTKTLVVTDLVFNISASAPALTRIMMRLGGAYAGAKAAHAKEGVRCSHLERVFMHRDAARADLKRILAWDFDRIVLAHGDVVETGGKAALAAAYRWLGEAPLLLES